MKGAPALSDSVETALKVGSGVVLISIVGGEELLFSEHFACVNCGVSLGEIAPRTFSFNSPHGACPACTGLGFKQEIDPDLVLNKELSVMQGAIRPWQFHNWYFWRVEPLAHRRGFSLHTPVKDLAKDQLDLLLYGEGGEMHEYRRFGKIVRRPEGFEGVIPNMERLYRETESERSRAEHRAVHGAQALPGVQRPPPQAGVALGVHRREEHHGNRRHAGDPGARLGE